MQLQSEIKDLLGQIGTSKISSAAYDTAWFARLIELDQSMGEQALAWLRENQHPNGCWGSEAVPYNHDRVICTLSAMTALAISGNERDKKRILRARLGLDVALRSLQADIAGATVGFEMIVPLLLDTAYELGAIQRKSDKDLTLAYRYVQNYDNPGVDALRRIDIIANYLIQGKEKKIATLPDGVLNRYVTAAFSAEMVGQSAINLLDIENIQEANGSVGCSPSATAYFALQVRPGDKAAINYLRDVAHQQGLGQGGGIPEMMPFNVFEIAWSLWHLSLIDSLDDEIKILCEPHLDFLEDTWKPERGVGFAAEFTPTDGDDTSIAFEALSRFGRTMDVDALLSYETNDHFRCYNLESNSSVGANIHILGALREAGFETQNPAVQKIYKFLLRHRVLSAFWADKWHTSPYYVTAHAVTVSAGYLDSLVSNSVDWIIETQRPDGAWGYYGPTAEETAHCLRAVFTWQQHGGQIPKDILKRGLGWLSENSEPPYEPLWISKCLYTPELIVRSAVLSALALEAHL